MIFSHSGLSLILHKFKVALLSVQLLKTLSLKDCSLPGVSHELLLAFLCLCSSLGLCGSALVAVALFFFLFLLTGFVSLCVETEILPGGSCTFAYRHCLCLWRVRARETQINLTLVFSQLGFFFKTSLCQPISAVMLEWLCWVTTRTRSKPANTWPNIFDYNGL